MRSPEIILLPSDDSPVAESARAIAESLAVRFHAELHDVFVATMGEGATEYEWPPDFGAPAPADEVTGPAVRVVRSVRVSDAPGPGILQYAREIRADLIVMATHARKGMERLVRGSTAEHVARRAPCPVLLVPPDGGRVPITGRVLVAHDFSDAATRALEVAREMAGVLDLPLDVMHVVEVVYAGSPFGPVTASIDYESARDGAERQLREVVTTVSPTISSAHLVTRIGGAVEEVLRFAEDSGAGMIVLGSHGRRGVGRLVLGSVAEGVARRAHCPVLVVPGAWNPSLAEATGSDSTSTRLSAA